MKNQTTQSLVLSWAFVTMITTATFTMTACQTVSTTNKNTDGNVSAERNPTEVAKIRTTLAGQYIKENQLDAAMRQLEQALQANSQYAPAYDMMGVLLQTEGSHINLQKADGYFKKAIALDNGFMQAHNNYGVYLSAMGQYDEAVNHFEVAASTLGYRGRLSALENLGRTYLQLGKTHEAKATFMKVLESNPNSVVAYVELIDLLLIEAKQTGQSAQVSKDKAQSLLNKLMGLLNDPEVNTLPPRILNQHHQLASHK